jgi:hypothetical protein
MSFAISTTNGLIGQGTGAQAIGTGTIWNINF